MHTLLSNLIKRRTLFALVLALTIFGAVYGFAATLSVGANTLSAGNAQVAACQTGQAKGTYAIAYDTTQKAYEVSGVTVTGLDATNCANKTVSVTLTGTNGTAILGSTMTGTVTATTLALTPSSTVLASDVTGVSVAING